MELDHKEPCVLTWEVGMLNYREPLKDVKQGSGIRLIIPCLLCTVLQIIQKYQNNSATIKATKQ